MAQVARRHQLVDGDRRPDRLDLANGTWYVQFRAFDVSGKASGWAPASPNPASTVKIDTLPPTGPSVSGGSLSWLSAASTTVTASGSTDAGVGFSHYEYQTRFFGGNWSAPVSGASVTHLGRGRDDRPVPRDRQPR